MPFALTQLAGFAAGGTSFLPTDVTSAALIGWYDETTMTLSGSNLTGWTNRSGTLATLTSSGAADPATATVAAINGKRAVQFNGTNNHLLTAAFVALTDPIHHFLIFSHDTWTNNDRVLHLKDDINTGIVRQRGVTPQVQLTDSGGDACAVSPTLGTWYLLETLWNGASSSQILGNGAAVTGNPGALDMDRIAMGAADDGTLPCDVNIAEWTVFDGEVSAGDLTSLRSYFNSTYGVATN